SSMLGTAPTTSTIATAFLIHGLVYAVFMSMGWLLVRVPADDWKPAGWEPKTDHGKAMISTANVSAANAIKTPQFWCLWVVLCFNVTAGIGILEKASPMLRDFFFSENTSTPAALASATGFVAL